MIVDPIEEAIFLAHHPAFTTTFVGQPASECARCKSAAEAVRAALEDRRMVCSHGVVFGAPCDFCGGVT